MRKKLKGFALLQALFFMMFIMAIISITMLMSSQRATSADGERLATDAYPALSAFTTYAQANLMTINSTISGATYFTNYPLSQTYINALVAEGFSDPSKDSNLTITRTSS